MSLTPLELRRRSELLRGLQHVTEYVTSPAPIGPWGQMSPEAVREWAGRTGSSDLDEVVRKVVFRLTRLAGVIRQQELVEKLKAQTPGDLHTGYAHKMLLTGCRAWPVDQTRHLLRVQPELLTPDAQVAFQELPGLVRDWLTADTGTFTQIRAAFCDAIRGLLDRDGSGAKAPPPTGVAGDDRHQGRAGKGEGDAADATSTLEPENREQLDTSSAEPAGMSWQEAAERLERLRTQGEPFTSQQKLGDDLGCSSSTINKAIMKTPTLHAWANARSARQPAEVSRAQSLNNPVTDRTAQNRELDPKDEAAIREFIEQADPETKACFLARGRSKTQLAYLDDPDKHQKILGRKG